MKRSTVPVLLFALAFLGVTTGCAAQKKPKIKNTVTFATSWESAVSEAKLLNLPIVVHSHGFF